MKWFRRYFSITLLCAVAFLLYVLFFNENSLMQAYEYNRQIDELKLEIKQNQDTLRHYQEMLIRLNTDPATMERIVREQYHMQRPSEDVYVFD